jgi:hypothetical protein
MTVTATSGITLEGRKISIGLEVGLYLQIAREMSPIRQKGLKHKLLDY